MRYSVLRSVWLVAVAASVVALATPSARAADPSASQDEYVTLIGDSSATAILWYPSALSILQQGLALRMEVAVCRRLTTESCPYEGSVPPNLLALVGSLGRQLGPTAIVVMGYNDFDRAFATSIDASLAALRKAGVQRVLWATLRTAKQPYVAMNDTLRVAAARHPELTVVDWNLYSRSHPDWFQNDGIHLTEAGGIAMATFLRGSLQRLESMAPTIVAVPLRPPVATVGRPYSWSPAVRGGVSPFRWVVSGPLPTGLSLRSDGSIAGIPRQAGDTSFVLRAVDGTGKVVTLHTSVTVGRR